MDVDGHEANANFVAREFAALALDGWKRRAIEADERIATLESAISRYVDAVDRDVIPEGDREVSDAFRGLKAVLK